MAQKDDVEKLEMRIARLEKLLDEAVGAREPVEVSPEELQAFKKVKDALAPDWGEFCGINDCFRCVVQRCLRCFEPQPLCKVCDIVCRPCDVECSCGPCGSRIPSRLPRRRFSRLGEDDDY